MSEPMTSQSAFPFHDPTSSSTQQAKFTSFSPGQTYIISEPSLPEDHMADFHHLDDAREIWLAVKARFGDHAGNAAGSVYDAAAEFAMMGISHKAKIENKEWEVKLKESQGRFDKWKESSKNLTKLINSSMSSRTKLGLGFKEFIRSDEVFDLSTPSVFDPEPENREVKSLYKRFVKAGEMHEVSLSITGTFMPTSYKSDLEETQDYDVYDNTDNFPFVVSKAASVPTRSRNSLASISAGRSIPAASRNRPASIHAGRHIPAGRFNRPAPFLASRSPRIYNHMSMNDGRWGSAVKSSAELASPEQTATGKDVSNPFMAVMMLLFYDHAVIDVPADCSCCFPYFCWFLVTAVWLFAAVLFRSCCWNKVTILEFSSEDLSRILKLTLSNSRLGEDCWELQISLDIDQVKCCLNTLMWSI
nr:ribonuclease H-like domain, reverse transcriptase, RNA-dependent DNA polymerase [Tanacetum cinerariifolium]